MSYDMNDAQPQISSDIIPDGTFAKITMTFRPGTIDGDSPIDQKLLKPSNSPGSDVRQIDAEFTLVEGLYARRKFWQFFTAIGGKVDEQGVSIGWKISKSTFRAMIDSVLPESQRRHFADGAACDFAFSVEGLGRYRANAYRQQRGVGMALRPIPETVPTLEAIHAPQILSALATHDHGLVLIVGPTGSGKTTTLAAMVDHINHTAAKHVLTVEDPVEFVYTPDRALITQREVGRDTPSFADALKAALREDPDVILLGEMRDLETIRLALTAAETGHLVLATLHTATAAQAVERIVDVFDAQVVGGMQWHDVLLGLEFVKRVA